MSGHRLSRRGWAIIPQNNQRVRPLWCKFSEPIHTLSELIHTLPCSLLPLRPASSNQDRANGRILFLSWEQVFESRVSQYNVGSRIGFVVRTSVPWTGSCRGEGPLRHARSSGDWTSESQAANVNVHSLSLLAKKPCCREITWGIWLRTFWTPNQLISFQKFKINLSSPYVPSWAWLSST